MSLTSRVINARPTKLSKHFCQMSLSMLSVAHLAFNVLDIRQNTVNTGHVQFEYIGYTLSGYDDTRHLKFTIDLEQRQLS